MIPTFGHHLIPLLSPHHRTGALGCLNQTAGIKKACKSAEHIHAVLALAGRHEIATVPAVPDFFDPAPSMAKARKLAWEVIRKTPHLQWVIPTRNPEFISRLLPPAWIGKGLENVCIGLVIDGTDDSSGKLQALRDTPLHCRAIFLTASSPPPDLSGLLHGFDWVVFEGYVENRLRAAVIAGTCYEARIPFLFHDPEEHFENHPECVEDIEISCIDPPWLIHPFGPEVQLYRPTLQELKTLSYTPTGITIKPVLTNLVNLFTVLLRPWRCGTESTEGQPPDKLICSARNYPPSPRRNRAVYAMLALTVVTAGLFWRSGIIPLPGWLSNYGGDALWALMVFLGIGFLLPRASTLTVAVLALTFAWGVEFSQLYRAPWIDAIRATIPGRLVLGNTFNWPDLLAYAVGIALGTLGERLFRRTL